MVAMHPRIFMRRALALALAYLVALQASPLTSALVSPGHTMATCLSAADASGGTGGEPAADHRGCALCALACNSGLIPPRRSGAILAEPLVATHRLLPRLAAELPVPLPGSRVPPARAPPGA